MTDSSHDSSRDAARGAASGGPSKRRMYSQVSHDAVDARHQGAVVMPVYQSSLFAFETHDAFDAAMEDVLQATVYSRGNNPTVTHLEQKIAALEGGESARCFGSGMGAIAGTIFALTGAGDHIVCVDQAYGPTRAFLTDLEERYQVQTTFVDGTDPNAFAAAVRPNTKLIYLESPTSMVFEMQDLPAIAAFARERGIITAVDNSWATPYFQRPLEMGCDLVLHSLTKYFSGHSDCLGGVVVGSERLISLIGKRSYLSLGAIMAPQAAALVTRGLRTLPIRMQRHQESAIAVAKFLESHPLVEQVLYPALPSHPQYELGRRQMTGYSGLFSFLPKLKREQTGQLVKRLRYFEEGPSWGGFESLINTPGLWMDEETSRAHGIPPGLLRVSIGLEPAELLMEDLDQALRSFS